MKIFRNILTLLFLSNIIFARPIVIKLATVAPEGTEYYNLLFEMGQRWQQETGGQVQLRICLLYTSPSPRDPKTSRMPSSA